MEAAEPGSEAAEVPDGLAAGDVDVAESIAGGKDGREAEVGRVAPVDAEGPEMRAPFGESAERAVPDLSVPGVG